jgi:hypothetical protein
VNGFYAVNVDNGGAFQTVSNSVLTQTGVWIWMMGRFISTTNRWLVTLDSRGTITQTQGTSSVPLGTAFNQIRIGTRCDGEPQSWSSGYLAESWYANRDICLEGGNAQLDPTLIRQLAYKGPFSVPYIADSVIDYKSLLYDVAGGAPAGAVGLGITPRNAYYSRYPSSNFNWVLAPGSTNANSGPHPPLSPEYAPPPQTLRRDIPIPLFAPPGGGGTRTRSFICG